jgi:hypothetical protein
VFILVIRYWPPGDIDFSGKRTLTDLVIMRAGKLNILQIVVADINHDGTVDLKDQELLKQILIDEMTKGE